MSIDAPPQQAAAAKTPSKRRSRWRRISLRGLLLLMTLCCLGFGVWTAYVEPFRVQRSVVSLVAELGGSFVAEPAEGAAWQRRLVTSLLGEAEFVRVIAIDLSETATGDAVLEEVARVLDLEELRLDRTRVTNRGLAPLGRLPKLRVLSLRFSGVTDAGLAQLIGLPREMEELGLSGSRISDASVTWFEGRTIAEVYLRWTDLTAEGAARIQRSLNKGVLHFGSPLPSGH